MEGNGLLLSVVMITYGHEKFIEQAIHGVLSQECDFDFELIVANDCSPDNTHIIIQDLIAKHPKASKIKYVRHDNNIGMMPNFLFALKSAKGKYIALCEGDDYWNLSSKVQKQVDFLEANSEFGLCHTNNSRFTQNTQKSIDDTTIKVSCIDVFSGLIKAQYPISTLTTVFHKTIWEQYIMDINPAGKDWLMGDLPFWLYLSKDYKVHYQDDITAVYRVVEESASNTQDLNKMIRFDKSVKEVKLFFLEKYAKDHNDIIKIKKEVEAIFIYRKIIAFAKCKGNLNNFFYLLFQFHKINREPRHFFGSFKQIFVRLF